MDENEFNSIIIGLAETIVLAGLAGGKEQGQFFIDNLRQSALMNAPPAQRVMFIIAGRAQERLDAWTARTETNESISDSPHA